MCLILDTNKYGDFINEHEDMKPVRNWINNKRGKIAYSPTEKFERRIKKVPAMKELFGQYRKSQKLKQIDKDEVNRAKKNILGKLKSDDSHIIALAIVAKVKLLVSGDKALIEDFDKIIKGKTYQYKKHKRLLTPNTCP